MDLVEISRRLARSQAGDIASAFEALNVRPDERDRQRASISRDAIMSMVLDLLRNPSVGSILASARFHVQRTPLRPRVQLFTRAADQTWLRTARSTEPVCACGQRCEGFSIGLGAPLVGRPTLADLEASGAPQPRKCVLCLRFWMGYTVTNISAEGGWVGDPHCTRCGGAGCTDCRVPLVFYWSRAGVKGEYAREHCFSVNPDKFTGLVAPAVFYVRSFCGPESAVQRQARLESAVLGSPEADPSVVFVRQDGYDVPARTQRAADFAQGFGRGGPGNTARRMLGGSRPPLVTWT